MECSKAREKLTELVDNVLSAGEATALREHIGTCSSCRDEHRRQSALWALLDRHPALPPTDRFAERVLERARRERLANVRRMPRLIVSAAAAALFLTIFFLPTATSPLRLPSESGRPPSIAVAIAPEDAEIVENLDVVENLELAGLLDVVADDRTSDTFAILTEIATEEDLR